MNDRDALAREDIKAKLRAEWTLGMDWAEIAMRHIEAERERCAEIVQDMGEDGEWVDGEWCLNPPSKIAAAIRAGSPAPAAPVVWTDAFCNALAVELFGDEQLLPDATCVRAALAQSSGGEDQS